MRQVLRNYFFVLLGNGTAGVLSFLISILLSRSMSVEGFGVYSLFFTIMVLVWQIPAFIDSSYVRYARTAPPPEARDYLRVNLVFKVRAAVLILGSSPVIGFVLDRWIFPGKAAFGILVMAVAGGAFLTFLTSMTANFQARERFDLYALGNISFYVAVLGVIAVLASRGTVLVPAAASVFLSAAAAAGIAAFLFLARRAWPLAPLNAAAAARMLRLGRWILYTGIFYVVLQRIDMLFVGHYFPKSDIGVFAAASRLLSALTVFLNAAASIYLPKAAVAVGSRSAWRAYGREASLLTGLILIVMGGLVLLAPQLLTLLFGARYAGAAGAMRTLFLGHLPHVLALPVAYLLYGLEDSFSNFIGMALCLGVNIAVNVALTPRLGLLGPGWAFGAGYSVYLIYILAAFFLRRDNRKRIAALR